MEVNVFIREKFNEPTMASLNIGTWFQKESGNFLYIKIQEIVTAHGDEFNVYCIECQCLDWVAVNEKVIPMRSVSIDGVI